MSTAAASPGAVSPAFAQFLREHRDELNRRFALARRRWPALDGDTFQGFLRDSADPLVAVAAAVRPDRAAQVARAACEVGLELVAHRLAGRGARHAWIERGWRTLGARAVLPVCQAPGEVLAAFSNALHNLATTPGARPESFLSDVERLGPQCADAEQLLQVGKVAGWRAGLAHFRASALTVADSLPEALALAVVGAMEGQTWRELREAFAGDPWFDPREAPTLVPQVCVMAHVGAFRGFGGAFTAPPKIASEDGCFYVASGNDRWQLTADRYGATLHRAPAGGPPAQAGQVTALPRDVATAGSRLTVRGTTLELGAAGEITSVAAATRTLAVTTRRSHRVALIRLGPA